MKNVKENCALTTSKQSVKHLLVACNVMILKRFHVVTDIIRYFWLRCAWFMIWWFNKNQQGFFFWLKQWNYVNYLIKVRYDFIQQTETLQSFLIDIRLCVKLFKVRDGGKHHTHRLVGLVIKVLITSNREITAGCVVAGDRRNAKICGFDVTREDLWAERWHRV